MEISVGMKFKGTMLDMEFEIVEITKEKVIIKDLKTGMKYLYTLESFKGCHTS